jgi:acyl-CoA hydrolase
MVCLDAVEPLANVQACVDRVLAEVGNDLRLATPLGIGKPNHLLNAFYRRARSDRSITLTVYSALTLERPKGASDLERRLLGPLVERVFGDYPDVDWEIDRVAGRLPDNVRVIEFYFPAGKFLGNAAVQRDHMNTNYTHVVRDLAVRGVNVLAQAVCAGVVDGRPRLNLSSNPDLTLDMVALFMDARRQGARNAIVAQINDRLPFMHGDAVVNPDVFDWVVDDPAQSYTLFGPPKTAVGDADQMIGLYASALVKDGGELQVGIGALGDAIAYALELRHRDNDRYLHALDALGMRETWGDAIARLGDTRPFAQGLFAASEMLVDAFMYLFDAGILKREVFDDVALQRLLNQERITRRVTMETLDLLRANKAVHERLTEEDVAYLRHFGVLHAGVSWREGVLVAPNGSSCVADLRDPAARGVIERGCLGTELRNGAVIHAAFFLGPQRFYAWLRELPEDKRRLIHMRSVTHINQLYGHEEIDRLHRRDARFVNTAMMATLSGAAISDGLDDGRVVSGVGGQYNFVAMAQELPGGRSVLQLRSTRETHGRTASSIVPSYGHLTIPRHLRDVFVTEYGIADLRGKTDEEVVQALLAVADSRFQPELMAHAKRVGKLRADYAIPERHRHNLPERYAAVLARLRKEGLFPAYPYGSDLTEVERTLGRVLKRLKKRIATRAGLSRAIGDAVAHGAPGEDVRPYLERMDLASPRSVQERLYARLLTAALRADK